MTLYSAKQKNVFLTQDAIVTALKVLGLIIVLYLFLKNKSLIILVVFEALDITKILLKKTIPYIPLDLVFIFGLAGSYYYGPIIGVIIFGLGLLNRTLLLSIELRHFVKCVRHFIFFFTIPFFTHLPFFTIALVMLFSNYVLKYGFKIAQGELGYFDKSHYHITNFVGSTIMFYLIYSIYSYMPFLA